MCWGQASSSGGGHTTFMLQNSTVTVGSDLRGVECLSLHPFHLVSGGSWGNQLGALPASCLVHCPWWSANTELLELPGKATCGVGADFSNLECSLVPLPLANSSSLQCGPGHHLEKISLVPGDWAAYLPLPLPQQSRHNGDCNCVLNCLSVLRVLSTLPVGREVVSPGWASLNGGMNWAAVQSRGSVPSAFLTGPRAIPHPPYGNTSACGCQQQFLQMSVLKRTVPPGHIQ